MKKALSPEKQLAGFLAKYTPEIGKLTRAVHAKLRKRMPGAIEMVYDNYNALVIGFSATERPSEAILSIVPMPKWVSVCFIQGAKLPDPKKLLNGSGNQVRHIRLTGGVADLDQPAVRALITAAIDRSVKPFDRKQPNQLVIRSISAKQRPRRPAVDAA